MCEIGAWQSSKADAGVVGKFKYETSEDNNLEGIPPLLSYKLNFI